MGSNLIQPIGWFTRSDSRSRSRSRKRLTLPLIGIMSSSAWPVMADNGALAVQGLSPWLGLGLIGAVLGIGLYLQSGSKKFR